MVSRTTTKIFSEARLKTINRGGVKVRVNRALTEAVSCPPQLME